MKTLALSAICGSLLFFLSVCAASALTIPERLVYDLSWSGLSAGKAVHEITAKGDEYHIVATTRSNGMMDSLFPIDDRSEAVLTRASGDRLGTPKYYYQKVKEGKARRLREARFDQQALKVETKDLIKKTVKTDSISSKTYDSLSSTYYIRTLELAPGKSVFIDIYDGKRLWNTEVKVLRREEVRTPLGTFKTLVVKPLLKAEGTVPKAGDMTLWLTDDSLRIPVLITTKVKLGKITATLSGGTYWPEAKGGE